jgi:hypothetical protein
MGTIPTNTPGRPFGDGQRVLCPPIYYLIRARPISCHQTNSIPAPYPLTLKRDSQNDIGEPRVDKSGSHKTTIAVDFRCVCQLQALPTRAARLQPAGQIESTKER